MLIKKIDIDILLEITTNLENDFLLLNMKEMEIDSLLEKTSDW